MSDSLNRVEYDITTGHIVINTDDRRQFPAYWAHPHRASRFPGVVLIHDWWGLTPAVRRLANQFASVGHYVIAPDLYDGQTAASAAEALRLLNALGQGAYRRIDAALSALETHHQCNGDVAAVGLGLGGSLAFEAALTRHDLEAAVAYAGFPQQFLGRFAGARAPILALYGSQDRHIPAQHIAALRAELAAQPLPHRVIVLEGAGHDIFSDDTAAAALGHARAAWAATLAFLDTLLDRPTRSTGPL